MSGQRRRALPDNLDPLVDTLSNVVGILVVLVLLLRAFVAPLYLVATVLLSCATALRRSRCSIRKLFRGPT